ncbi:MAG: anti-sigma factor domain-containing protein [Actinomycetes bacterium]
MTSQTTHDDDEHVGHLTGAYALDAVDDVERARVERHLGRCESCAAEVRSFTETAALLATGAHASPPPGLRARVLDEASRTRQLPPEVHAPAPGGRAAPANRWLAVAAASALVLAVALGGVAWQQRQSAQELAAVAEAMSEVLTDPGRQVVDTTFASGRGTVVVSGDRVVLVGTDVPAPPDGRAYQLWFIGADGPRPAGMLTRADGRFWADATGIEAGEAVGVTVEPAGGSEQPTSDPVLVAETGSLQG